MPRIHIAELKDVSIYQNRPWPFAPGIPAPTTGSKYDQLNFYIDKSNANDPGRIIVEHPATAPAATKTHVVELSSNPKQLNVMLGNISCASPRIHSDIKPQLTNANGIIDIVSYEGKVYVGQYGDNPTPHSAPKEKFHNLAALEFDQADKLLVTPCQAATKQKLSELRYDYNINVANYNGHNLTNIGQQLFTDLAQIADTSTVNLVRKTLSATVRRADGTGNGVADRLEALEALISHLTTDETQRHPAPVGATAATLSSLVPATTTLLGGTQDITAANFKQLHDHLALSTNPFSPAFIRFFPAELDGVGGQTQQDLANIIQPAILKGVMDKYVITPGIRTPLTSALGTGIDSSKLILDGIADAVNAPNNADGITTASTQEKAQAIIDVTRALKTELDILNSNPTTAQLQTTIKKLGKNVARHPQITGPNNHLSATTKDEFKKVAKLAQIKARIELAKKTDINVFPTGSKTKKAMETKVQAAEAKLKDLVERDTALAAVQTELVNITAGLSSIIKVNALYQKLTSLKANPVTKKQGERLEETLNKKQQGEQGEQSSLKAILDKALETGDAAKVDSTIDAIVNDTDTYIQLGEAKANLASWQSLVNTQARRYIAQPHQAFAQTITDEALKFNIEARALSKKIDEELKSDSPNLDEIRIQLDMLQDRAPLPGQPIAVTGSANRATLATQLQGLRARLGSEASVVGSLSKHPELFRPEGLQVDTGTQANGADHPIPTGTTKTASVAALATALHTQSQPSHANPVNLRGTIPLGQAGDGSDTALTERYAYAEQRLNQLSKEIHTLEPHANISTIVNEIAALSTFLDDAKMARNASGLLSRRNTQLEDIFQYHREQTPDLTAPAPFNIRLALLHNAVNQLDTTTHAITSTIARASGQAVPTNHNTHANFYQQTRDSIDTLTRKIAVTKRAYTHISAQGQHQAATAHEANINLYTKEAIKQVKKLQTLTIIAELNTKLDDALTHRQTTSNGMAFLLGRSTNALEPTEKKAYQTKQQELLKALNLLQQPDANVDAITKSVSMLESDIMLLPGMIQGQHAKAEKRAEQFRLIQKFAKTLGLTPSTLNKILNASEINALTHNGQYRPSDTSLQGINHTQTNYTTGDSYTHTSGNMLENVIKKLKTAYHTQRQIQDDTSTEILQHAQNLQVRLNTIEGKHLSATEADNLDSFLVETNEFIDYLEKFNVDLNKQITTLESNGGIGDITAMEKRLNTLQSKQRSCKQLAATLKSTVQKIEQDKVQIKAAAKPMWRIDSPTLNPGTALIPGGASDYTEFDPTKDLKTGLVGGIKQNLSWRRSKREHNRFAYVATKQGKEVIIHHNVTIPFPGSTYGETGCATFKKGQPAKTPQEFAEDVSLAIDDLSHMRGKSSKTIADELYTVKGANTRDLLIAVRAAKNVGMENLRIIHTGKAGFGYNRQGNPRILSWDQEKLETQLQREMKAEGKTSQQIEQTFSDIDEAVQTNAAYTQQTLGSIKSNLFNTAKRGSDATPSTPIIAHGA